ncbi:SNF2-related protein [Formosa maritima]|uniref:DEAD/DEAH box helicase n=1 Tax=Formosa maritima TaxID=2592046 RepID=A0A5D0G2E8_9FLAO|nr:SNF2-related protein [Formosa maritima]TYA53048.1 DEAD/DEAH box helicase [Formosa maritima]
MITDYQAKYFAHELTRRLPANDIGKFTASLQDAQVDMNPHQVEAALFAFQSPLSKGALLADEVGLGKTIEAGIIISQKWAERKRKLLIICPANLRKQWNQELSDKFFIPSTVLESKSFTQLKKQGKKNPFNQEQIILASFQFIRSKEEFVRMIDWDLVIIDEAHRLRNVYKPKNKIANAIKSAIQHAPKILLTATPLQNSILELYGLVSFIDEYAFGDLKSFKTQFGRITTEDSFLELKERLKPVCIRTLRRQVLEYINYTNRIAIVEEYFPFQDEKILYDLVSEYLQTPKLYALPNSQRQLMTLILRKLLASSTYAISGTLEALENKLKAILADQKFLNEKVELGTEFETIDELEEEWGDEELNSFELLTDEELAEVQAELDNVSTFRELAVSIEKNAKGEKLLTALNKGFEKLEELGANQKAIIFTESTRTQKYLLDHLSSNGYNDKIVLFNGSNNDVKSRQIYKDWIEEHNGTDRVSGAKAADIRQAIVDYFRNTATILIATEAAAEGINLQFCSLLVNYDMPWNPQRIEQRIGRVHRYGQKHDVVVINFLNKSNEADQRVYELLDQKFQLFNGVFGASDEVLGSISSGVDFEKRIAQIYQECRQPSEIKNAFDTLQQEMDESINTRIDETREQLLEHFDDEVHQKLKVNLEKGKSYLNQYENWLWAVTKHYLKGYAEFDFKRDIFRLKKNPFPQFKINEGPYQLLKSGDSIKKSQQELDNDANLYRIGHPLAKQIVEACKTKQLEVQKVIFDYSNHPKNMAILEDYIGSTGTLRVNQLSILSFEEEDYLLIQIIDKQDNKIDSEIAQKMFSLPAKTKNINSISYDIDQLLKKIFKAQKQVVLEDNLQRNAEFFDQEYDKLDKWADDMKISLEREIQDIDAEIKLRKAEARKKLDLQTKVKEQRAIKELEKKRNEKRKHLFEAQDQIDDKKDDVLSNIEERLAQRIVEQELFTIEWELI